MCVPGDPALLPDEPARRVPAAYPDVTRSPNLADIEEQVLKSWETAGTFARSVEGRRGSQEFVFYDGPPFANGLPHYGHLLTGFVKDAVPRYQTMRGRLVERRFGWDCHGLPAEIEAEKELGVSGRAAIGEYGIDAFNNFCRSSVLRYTDEWRRYVTRQARWVDFDNDYKTMDLSYMESVMWALAELYGKGLLYEDYRVLPYCWECETPLSNSETRQDDAYRERQDPAVTVAFHLPGPDPIDLWVWTTTPWTLPSNLALAVGAEIDYAVFEREGSHFAIAADRLDAYEKSLQGATRTATLRGSDLVGRSYEPLFPYFSATANAFVVLGAQFVNTDEGTGIVHMAPGFGEDDQIACAQAGIPVVCPVDDRTRFTGEVPDFEGMQVFEANQPVIRVLREKGSLVRSDSYVHSYPHCWRSDTPLVYRAVSSWFVKVTAIKAQLAEANTKIGWVPEHVKDGSFGRWLDNARDWSISRNRFWGSPIPVWKSDNPDYPRIDVYGSLDAIEADFGVRPVDLHRPAIDELTRPNPDDPTGRSTMRRIPDVLDCWFESGSMPFAQVHYPFENKEWFDTHFPGDFIVEYIGQTRGWFYTLHVLAVALFGRPAFSNCLAHGILLGDDGAKLSKRLRNYPDPLAMFDRYGADAMRWFLLSSTIMRGGDMIVDEGGIKEAVRAAVLPYWNAWYFFALYANADRRSADHQRSDSSNLLDRYIIAKLANAVASAGASMESFDLSGTTAIIESFLDSLNNWYIRRSRDRFWGTGSGRETDTQDAFDTLATVLEILSRLAAPLLPMISEVVWRGLTGGESVHLTDWPSEGQLRPDDVLVQRMDLARDVCGAAHSLRKANNLRARLPLGELTVAGPQAGELADLVELIADEVNVRSVVLCDDPALFASPQLSVVFKVAAPRLGPAIQGVAAAAKRGDWEIQGDRSARVGTEVLLEGEYEMRVNPLDPATTRTLPGMAGVVVLDLEVTPELALEGRARDLVREVQQIRRDLGLEVSDRINLAVGGDVDVREALDSHGDWLAEQVLAASLTWVDTVGDEATWRQVELADGSAAAVSVVVAG